VASGFDTPRGQDAVATIARADKLDSAKRQDAEERSKDHQLHQMLSIASSHAVRNPGTAINNAGSSRRPGSGDGRPGSSTDRFR
ncbi:MAG: hypothetical protein EBT55_05470, partial [Proteobacteria bacterium]|nr:hypothetical protein [Pseudomonadota bacterium]